MREHETPPGPRPTPLASPRSYLSQRVSILLKQNNKRSQHLSIIYCRVVYHAPTEWQVVPKAFGMSQHVTAHNIRASSWKFILCRQNAYCWEKSSLCRHWMSCKSSLFARTVQSVSTACSLFSSWRHWGGAQSLTPLSVGTGRQLDKWTGGQVDRITESLIP